MFLKEFHVLMFTAEVAEYRNVRELSTLHVHPVWLFYILSLLFFASKGLRFAQFIVNTSSMVLHTMGYYRSTTLF